jgi:hypothetical protein
MEPLNDDELNDLLCQWQAPSAPAGLDARILGSEPVLSWWSWLIRGSIRVPVPAGILALVILALAVYWAVSARRMAGKPGQTATFADFQPVKQLQPRIIRSGYEGQ